MPGFHLFARNASALALSAAAVLTASSAHAGELITNGDFANNGAGYQTQYTGTDATGYQFFATNPHDVCNCFASIDGSSNGHGNQLVLDGAANGGYFFQETVSIVAGTAYTLSFDAANLGNAGPIPNIVATINGLPLLTTGLLAYDDTYRTYSTTFNAGLATSATISLSDLTMDHSYNDFAIDNVSFIGAIPAAGVPEPATWTLLIGGFGFVGAAMRSRASRVAMV